MNYTTMVKPMVVAVLATLAATAVPAQAAIDTVKIGFVTDMSGLYADIDGKGGLEAIRMAVADFGGKVLSKPIEVLYADHQNKADVAASKAREWFDRENLNMLVGGSNSAAALAMNRISSEKKRVFISVGAATDRLTNEECQPYGVHYAFDTVALAHGTGSAVVKRGGRTWYFLIADYAFGHALESATADVVKSEGGKILGSVKHPLSASDFSSYLLQAQSSGAQVLGLANAGGDTVNSIKAAREFGIQNKMKIAGLLVFINDIHSLGLQNTGGMYLTDTWYWDKDEASRMFAKRYFERMKKMPSSIQAADYSAVTTYLRAVQAAGTTDSGKVMVELKKIKINDMFAQGYIRSDGVMIHNMYLMQVKNPTESKVPWDYYKVLATIPGEAAFATVGESKCPLLKKQ